MNDEWRLTAKSITKYNPIYRDKDGVYTRNEWIGFFQIGETINGKMLTLEDYLQVEKKYIQSAIAFFQFHGCREIVLKHLEKNGPFHSTLSGDDELLNVYDLLKDRMIVTIEHLDIIIKLILRDYIWAELLSLESDLVAIRFGYDFYMYVNSDKELDTFFNDVHKTGLFVW